MLFHHIIFDIIFYTSFSQGIQSIVWAGPGLLAAATEEKIIRLFDLATDESYNLSMNNALGRMMDRADRVVCVTFSPVDR